MAFGSFGIKALETKWITGRQIEAARIAVTRYMQRQGQIWSRIFPDKDVYKRQGVGFKDIHTGDTLFDENAPIVLESMDFPEPVDVYKRQSYNRRTDCGRR